MCPLSPFFSETTRPKSMKLCMVASYACLQVLKPFWYPYLPPQSFSSPKTALLGEMSLCPTNVLMSDKNVLMSDKMSLCPTKCPYVRQNCPYVRQFYLCPTNCLFVRQYVPWSHRRRATKAEGRQVASLE